MSDSTHVASGWNVTMTSGRALSIADLMKRYFLRDKSSALFFLRVALFGIKQTRILINVLNRCSILLWGKQFIKRTFGSTKNAGVPFCGSYPRHVTLYPLELRLFAISKKTFSVPPLALITRHKLTRTIFFTVPVCEGGGGVTTFVIR